MTLRHFGGYCLCLALMVAVAAASSAACLTDGCWTGCKVWSKWCNNLGTGYDFGTTGVVISSSCAINPDGGISGTLALRSYDVYDCEMECPSDTISPGNMIGQRESTSQGMYDTACRTITP